MRSGSQPPLFLKERDTKARKHYPWRDFSGYYSLDGDLKAGPAISSTHRPSPQTHTHTCTHVCLHRHHHHHQVAESKRHKGEGPSPNSPLIAKPCDLWGATALPSPRLLIWPGYFTARKHL